MFYMHRVVYLYCTQLCE